MRDRRDRGLVLAPVSRACRREKMLGKLRVLITLNPSYAIHIILLRQMSIAVLTQQNGSHNVNREDHHRLGLCSTCSVD